MKTIYRFITGLLFTSPIFSCQAQNSNILSPDEFQKEISAKDNIQILDVRTPGEYFSGHIKNAMLADWNDKKEFERRIEFIDKNKPVYVYCLGGGRSAAAAKKMNTLGFTHVYELAGGTNAWRASNKPLEGSSNEKQMTLESFNEQVSNKTVLVDFGATWCPPCKQMEPVINNLQKKYSEKFALLKVDGGRDQDILKEYKVTALPVFIIFKNGKQVWRKDGVASEEEIATHF